MLLHCGGMQLQDICFALKEDLCMYEDTEKALKQYFRPSINVAYHLSAMCLGMRVKEMTKQSSNSLRG